MERRRKSNSDTGTFWDHLEILRRKILVTAVLIGLVAVIFFILGDRVLAELLRYPREMGIEVVYLRPQEKFAAYLRMVTMCAVICGVPLAIIETASFIVPGLHRGERRVFIPAVGVMLLLYTGGVLFGYFLLVPYVIGFFSAFGRADIMPFWSIGAYIQIHLSMVLLCGLIFFFPLALFAGVKMGIIDVGTLTRGRRYVLLGLFIAAALLTPPDVFTQIAVGSVLYLLYEITIAAVKVTMPKKSQNTRDKEKTDE